MTQRTVRVRDVKAGDTPNLNHGIDDLYDDRVDVIVIRGAFPRAPVAAASANAAPRAKVFVVFEYEF